MKRLISISSILFSIASFSQNSVEDVLINQVNDEIQVSYALNRTQNYRKIASSYSVGLYISKDGGVNYELVDDATGDVGDKIYFGKNKKVYWKPNTLVGRYQFKINANPYFERGSFGILYTQSLLYQDDETHISLKTLWTIPTKRKGNTLLVIGAKSVNGTDQWMIPIGIGYQTIGKSFASYLCLGFGQLTDNIAPDSDEIYTQLAFSLDFGILLGIPIRNPKISIPLEVSLVADTGVALSTGLAIQFNYK